MCYTCCVLHASCKSDTVEDFSTTELQNTSCQTQRQRRGSLCPGTASASALSHPFPRPGREAVPFLLLFLVLWGFQSHCRPGGAGAQISEGFGRESRATLAAWGCLPTSQFLVLGSPQTCSASPGSPQGPLSSIS